MNISRLVGVVSVFRSSQIHTLIAGMVTLLCITSTHATSINVIGYDIIGASVSGTGGWSHTYNGTITPTVDEFADYSGGIGTMADGVIGQSPANTQLFNRGPSGISITVFLDAFYTIDTVELYGGSFTENDIPGAISGAEYTIASASLNLIGTPFGPAGSGTQQVNDLFTLSGTSLGSLVTDRFTITNITSSDILERISITEIVVNGSVVPIPAAVWLFGSGLIGLIGVARGKKS